METAVHVLNGPNTNLYGLDPGGPYGKTTLAEIERRCGIRAEQNGFSIEFRQTNHESVLIDQVQAARAQAAAIIINGGSATYTSIALLDALLAFEGPIMEVHVSNIHRREPFRAHSFISRAATGMIAGLGARGYELAIDAIADLLAPRAAA